MLDEEKEEVKVAIKKLKEEGKKQLKKVKKDVTEANRKYDKRERKMKRPKLKGAKKRLNEKHRQPWEDKKELEEVQKAMQEWLREAEKEK